jgi:hypothetical protein
MLRPNIIILADSKSVLPLNRKFFIEYQIDTINQVYFNPTIIIIAGREYSLLNNKLYDKKVNLIYNKYYECYGTAYSIYLAIKYLNNQTLYIIHGNLILNINILQTLYKENSKIIINKLTKNNCRNVGVNIFNNKLVSFDYSVPIKYIGACSLRRKEYEQYFKKYNPRLFYFEILEDCIRNELIQIETVYHEAFQINKLSDMKKYENTFST